MNKKLNTKQNCLNVMVDCWGYGEEEALEEAKEYNNNLTKIIIDRVPEDDAERVITECKAFCGITD